MGQAPAWGAELSCCRSATVKVLLVPHGHVTTVSAPPSVSIRELRVPAEVLLMALDGSRNLLSPSSSYHLRDSAQEGGGV